MQYKIHVFMYELYVFKFGNVIILTNNQDKLLLTGWGLLLGKVELHSQVAKVFFLVTWALSVE